jgi:hypothetical protein
VRDRLQPPRNKRLPDPSSVDMNRAESRYTLGAIMKAISIRPPWAWAILHAKKDVENRTWKTNMRGTVAIHASQTMSRSYYESAVKEIKRLAASAKVPPYEAMVRGAIVGLVDVVGCEERTQSKWHVHNHYGFVLANPRALLKAIPCNGRLNFWEVPHGIARRISASC